VKNTRLQVAEHDMVVAYQDWLDNFSDEHFRKKFEAAQKLVKKLKEINYV
jgi:thiaminase